MLTFEPLLNPVFAPFQLLFSNILQYTQILVFMHEYVCQLLVQHVEICVCWIAETWVVCGNRSVAFSFSLSLSLSLSHTQLKSWKHVLIRICACITHLHWLNVTRNAVSNSSDLHMHKRYNTRRNKMIICLSLLPLLSLPSSLPPSPSPPSLPPPLPSLPHPSVTCCFFNGASLGSRYGGPFVSSRYSIIDICNNNNIMQGRKLL